MEIVNYLGNIIMYIISFGFVICSSIYLLEKIKYRYRKELEQEKLRKS